MSQFGSKEAERDAVRMVAAPMATSARTAPKARGANAIKIAIIEGEELITLASAMESKAAEQPPYLSPSFARDANSLRESSCVLLIGVTGVPKKMEQPLDCGACGYKTCQRMLKARGGEGKDFYGPNCIFQVLDLGIALASAARIASDLSVDNRMMYTIGAAAKALKFLDSDIIIGIPLSATVKSPYFDR